MALTGRPLDLQIRGAGYFALRGPESAPNCYTRYGSFKVDKLGKLIGVQNYPLNTHLLIPSRATSVRVSPNGFVEVIIADPKLPASASSAQTSTKIVGRIELTVFTNPSALKPAGAAAPHVFVPTKESGTGVSGVCGLRGFGQLLQGHLEDNYDCFAKKLCHMLQSACSESNMPYT